MRKSWQGYFFLLLAQFMVGICIVGSKYLLHTIPDIIILTTRFIIGFVFLLAMHLILNKKNSFPLRKLSRLDWVFIVAQALCAGALFNILLLLGLKYTSASVAGIITSTLPAIIVILSIFFLKEKVTLFTILCVVFSVLGLVIINVNNFHIGNKDQVYGDIIILISLLPEAAYYVISKYHKNKLPIFLVSALMNGINIPILLFLFLFFHHEFSIQTIYAQYLPLVIVGIASAMFYVFWFLGCNKVHGSSIGLTAAFMPIATMINAYLFLNEKIMTLQFLGMVFVICSIVFNAFKQGIQDKKIQLNEKY